MSDELISGVIQAIVAGGIALIVAAITTWVAIIQIKRNGEAAKAEVAASLEAAQLSYRAQVLSANRQAWINALRDLVSEISGLLHGAHDDLLNRRGISLEKFERFAFLFTKLKLMLNPNEAVTIELIDSLEDWKEVIEKEPNDTAAFDAAHKRAIETAGRILKSEWVRVKEGR